MNDLTNAEKADIAVKFSNAISASTHMNDEEIKALLKEVIKEDKNIPDSDKEKAFNIYSEVILQRRKTQQ